MLIFIKIPGPLECKTIHIILIALEGKHDPISSAAPPWAPGISISTSTRRATATKKQTMRYRCNGRMMRSFCTDRHVICGYPSEA
jgi:hypothetical protein